MDGKSWYCLYKELIENYDPNRKIGIRALNAFIRRYFGTYHLRDLTYEEFRDKLASVTDEELSNLRGVGVKSFEWLKMVGDRINETKES